MRKGIALVLLAVGLLVLAWVAHSKIAEARREATYRAAIAPFEHDLRLGLDKADVQAYLASRNVDYHPVRYGGSDADTYEIKIGEENGSLVCEHWTVYIALEFSAADKLRKVHVRKIGTCL